MILTIHSLKFPSNTTFQQSQNSLYITTNLYFIITHIQLKSRQLGYNDPDTTRPWERNIMKNHIMPTLIYSLLANLD
jgi:hypothetical protein